MKKLLGIIVLSLLWCNISFADNEHLDDFHQWLYENGHHQYLNIEPKEVCKKLIQQHGLKLPKVGLVDEPKYRSMEWFSNKCHKFRATNNLKIKFYKNRWTIPWDAKPNMDTLLYYFYKYQYSHTVKVSRKHKGTGTRKWDRYEANPSGNFFQFKSNLKEDKYIKKQMSKTAMLSYILYEDGKITIDEISPKDRFGNFVNNETKFRSMSVGKTMVSYVMGHAICKGYIDSIDSTLNDWDLANNTLYENQKIIDLLNMAAGDQKYIGMSGFKDGGDEDTITAKEAMKKMSNKKKSKSKYNYTGLLPHLLLNYILFKSGDDFENLLEDVFKNKVKIEHSVYFFKHPKTHKDEGNANSMFYATRYDYLRIAKAMLDDWQNDTCVGKYLKTIHERRIPKNHDRTPFQKQTDNKSSWFNPKSYAGFFHTDYAGFKDKAIMGMGGYGGQSIIIDFEKGRIVVISSIHLNYNWHKIAISKFK